MSDKTTWRFNALDTWFFRESRPHDSAGGSQLSSLFPPPIRTLVGAIRTLIGEVHKVDWEEFGRQADHHVRSLIGFGDELGLLAFEGPWLYHDEKQRLYPVPAFLLKKEAAEGEGYIHLTIGNVVRCDMGRVRLPCLDKADSGAKPIEQCWLTRRGLIAVLTGNAPEPTEIIDNRTLFEPEPRLGIARNNTTRTAQDAQLYQTVHVRPRATLSVEVDVKITAREPSHKLPEKERTHLVRLGGEGRTAQVSLRHSTDEIPRPDSQQFVGNQLILVLLTPARVNNCKGLPDGSTIPSDKDYDTWKTTINGVPLTIHSAVIGKAQREGGWDMANRKPRPVQSLIPAGSTWYCTVDNDMEMEEAIEKLTGAQIGEPSEQALGRGLLTVGVWTDQHTQQNDPARSTQ